MLVARLLSPADLGAYFVLRSVSGGSTQAALHIVRHVARTSVLLAPSAGAVTLLGSRFAGTSWPDAVLTALAAVLLAWMTVLGGLVRGTGRVVVVAVAERIVGSLADVLLLLALLLAFGETTLTTALTVSVVAFLPPIGTLAGVLVRASTNRSVETSTGKPTEPLEGLADESWPVAANALLWKGLVEVDLWLVAGLAGAREAAIYGIASRVVAPLQATMAIAIFALSGPAAALHTQRRYAELEQMLKRAARQALGITVVGYVVLLLVGTDGLALAFGEMYARAMPLVIILGLSQVLNVGAGLGGTTLLMIGRSRTLLGLSLISTTFTAVAAAALLSWMGVIGAAIASAAGVALQNALALRAVHRRTGMSIHAGPGHA